MNKMNLNLNMFFPKKKIPLLEHKSEINKQKLYLYIIYYNNRYSNIIFKQKWFIYKSERKRAKF
jgi:hypothetical protein